jgi:hypothetical protein
MDLAAQLPLRPAQPDESLAAPRSVRRSWPSGVQPAWQVAIDGDWSASRFRLA